MIGEVIAIVVIATAVFVAVRRMAASYPDIVVTITADTTQFEAALRDLQERAEACAATIFTRLVPAFTRAAEALRASGVSVADVERVMRQSRMTGKTETPTID